MPVALSLLLVVFFLLMNAFFVVAEFSLVRVRKSQVDMLAAEGRPGAKNASLIAGNVNAYLSACQLGITLASLALGWLGEPAVSALFHPLFELVHLPEAAVEAVSVAIGFVIVTALHIVVGELIPKSLAIFSTERYALFTATPLVWFYRITYPIMWLFNTITNGVMRLLGHDPADEHQVYTEDEIRLLIDESTESGLIDSEQNEFVDNIFDITEKEVASIMTPRTDMVCLCLEDTLKENLAIVDEHKFTRYPIYRRDKDDIVGFVHIKDLYDLGPDATMSDLRIRRIVAVPESMYVTSLLDSLRTNRTKIAIAVDEHGGTAGIVTLGDVFNEIVGEFEDEYLHDNVSDDAPEEVEPGHFLMDGSYPMDDLVDVLGIDPEEEEGLHSCDTLAGLLLDLFDHIPEEGEETVYVKEAPGEVRTLRFLVREMEGNRIARVEVWVSVLTPVEAE
ncbi:MAG: HlyC/CorC family transporter [Coriobacteriia bacterium]|nr:HlyC/CorC family transporter [Coriobacteriia bacterium]MBS5477867.1 HlyC/CorC family transporter [Coriobacteriia bacterium]